MAEKASLMKIALDVRPLHERLMMLKELMLWFKRTGELMSLI
jgi:hypothetical protein